ncbi:Adenylate kinase isoenzyme [Trichinella spiralis]|uniref:Adenylate kinase isoenzyme n=1 Tax=Trichinella spiralis TaxID=6334 RepID=A0ABR3KXF5_TRISP
MVVGTPATGKTTIISEVAKRCGMALMQLSEIAIKHGFTLDYDSTYSCDVLDESRLLEHIKPQVLRGGNIRNCCTTVCSLGSTANRRSEVTWNVKYSGQLMMKWIKKRWQNNFTDRGFESPFCCSIIMNEGVKIFCRVTAVVS